MELLALHNAIKKPPRSDERDGELFCGTEIISVKKDLVGTRDVDVTSVLSNYQSLTANNFFIITKSAYIQSYGRQYTIGQLTYTAATGNLHINGDLTNGDRYMITYDIYYTSNPLP